MGEKAIFRVKLRDVLAAFLFHDVTVYLVVLSQVGYNIV